MSTCTVCDKPVELVVMRQWRHADGKVYRHRIAVSDDLPEVLSSVDDVARVCVAAGLQALDDLNWTDDTDMRVTANDFSTDLDEVRVEDGDDADIATVHGGAPAWLLWCAIEAARGGDQ